MDKACLGHQEQAEPEREVILLSQQLSGADRTSLSP